MTEPAPAPLPPVPDPATNESEPMAFVGGVGTMVAAAIALLVSFGLPLTAAQQSGILGLAVMLAPAIVALVGRSRVYSPKSVARLLIAANEVYARTGLIGKVPPPPPATPGPAAGPPAL